MRSIHGELVYPDILPDVAALREPVALSTHEELAQRQMLADHELTISTYQPRDHQQVLRLYTHGLMLGWADPFDSAADLDRIEQTYLNHPRNHFWVARVRGRVVGMIAVTHDRPHVAQIRRLRVDRAWQETCVATRLMETALEHCKRCGFLKLVLATHFYLDRAIELSGRHGYQHARSRQGTGKQMMEFYLNLYRRSDAEDAARASLR